MKTNTKKSMILLCSAALLLSGCKSTSEITTTSSQTDETTSASVSKTTAPTETTNPDTEVSVSEISVTDDIAEERSKGIIRLSDMYADWKPEYEGGYDYGGDNAAWLYANDCEYGYYRYSEEDGALIQNVYNYTMQTRPGFLYTDNLDFLKEASVVDEEKNVADDYSYVSSYLDYSNPYNFYVVPQRIICDKADISDPNNKKLIDATIVESYYRSDEKIIVNAFLNKENGAVHFYIDPAYTYSLPSVNGNIKSLTFCTINGVETCMSTLEFADCALSDEAGKALSDVGEKYVYAKLTLDGMSVDPKGEKNETSVLSAEIIEQDGEKALYNVYLNESDSSAEKPEEMKALYELLNGSVSEWYDESVVGVTLIDLDDDGTPEVLFSSEVSNPEIDEYSKDVITEVNIFRNGELKKVGELRSDKSYRTYFPQLTAKTLDDGSKAWYHMASVNYSTGERQDMSYLIKLVDDKLEFTEIFRIENETVGGDYGGHPVYYMGERFQPGNAFFEEVYEHYKDEYNLEYSTDMGISYGKNNDGDVHALGDLARGYYTEQLDGENYCLVDDFFYYDGFVFELYPKITERMFSYHIAIIVDGAYLGEYNPSLKEKSYGFVGAYAKPVIYLYPEEKTEVSVQVGFTDGGELTCTYPEYNDGWNVTAMPDGTLFDADGNEYYCLYWEGEGKAALDMSEGWCVPADETADFLREKLLYIGLTSREANEFIIYWLPQMQKNPYNIITFHTEDYAAAVPLAVNPMTDSQIRVFMTFKPTDEFISTEPQELEHYERNGFTLVEWGGAEVSE